MVSDDEGSLRKKIHEAIQAGELPNRLPDRVWGGPATAGRCAVCGQPTDGGIEFELVFTDEGKAVEKSCCVHDPCLKAFERAVLGLPERTADTGALVGASERPDAS